jgi:AcrR family transcriptional regulator
MSAILTHPRWQRRAEARPQELLAAALAVFVEKGYAATRLEEVARRAGVAKATLYLYYENKLELFKAVVRHALVANFDAVAREQADVECGAREALSHFMTEFMRRVADSPVSGIPKLVMAEAGNFPELARFYHDEVIRRGRTMVTGVLERGIAAGEFRAVDTDYAWRVVIAPLMLAIIWKHSFAAFEAEALDFERHLAAHLDLLFNGLAATAKKE